jgi:hypothetical protein
MSFQASEDSVALSVMRELNDDSSAGCIFPQHVVKTSANRVSEKREINRVQNAGFATSQTADQAVEAPCKGHRRLQV